MSEQNKGTKRTKDTLGYFPGDELPYGQWYAISEIQPWLLNPSSRSKRDAAYKELLWKLSTYGQVRPIIFVDWEREHNILCDGNRRYRAVAELGWTHIWSVSHGAKNPLYLAALLNGSTRRHEGRDIPELVSVAYDVLDYVDRSKAVKLRLLADLLGITEYKQFAGRFGDRAYDVARRVQRYLHGAGLNWQHKDIRIVLLYMIHQPEGVVRRLEEALRGGIDPNRLATIIRSGRLLEPTW